MSGAVMSVLFSLLAVAGLATQPVAAVCNDSLAAQLSTRITPELSASAAGGRFSGVVLISCNGKAVYAGAYGMANRAQRRRNTLDTRFNLGSMNKMWTAIAIAQLVERKEIDLNAPVGRYLPDLPNRTIRETVLITHLLTHTSGMGSYFTRGYLEDRPALASAADLARFFVQDSLAFPPGARFAYSNAGFALLGMIVERVSGMNYFEYVRRNVIARAGMTTAAFVTLPSNDPTLAMGYATPPGTPDTLENWNMVERSSSPAGGAFATAQDLVNFGRALWSGALVSRALVDEFTTGKVPMGPLKYAYGFGESVENGWRAVGHNGGAPGVSADFKSFPEQGIDIVVLANVDAPAADEAMSLAVSALTGAPRRRMMLRPPPGAPSGPDGAVMRMGPDGRSAPDAARPAQATGIPDTPLGRRATAFLRAFSTGGEAMAAFIAQEMVPSDVSAAERARRSEEPRARFGTLTFRDVLRASATELVLAVDGSTSGPLMITFLGEAVAPFRLLRANFSPMP